MQIHEGLGQRSDLPLSISTPLPYRKAVVLCRNWGNSSHDSLHQGHLASSESWSCRSGVQLCLLLAGQTLLSWTEQQNLHGYGPVQLALSEPSLAGWLD